MTDANELPQPRPEGGSLSRLAVPAILAVLLVVAAGWGWLAQRGKAEAEAALAEAVAQRDAAVSERDAAQQAAEQSKDALAQAQGDATAGQTRMTELEQQVHALDGLLAGANADVTKLRADLQARTTAPAPAPPEDITAEEPAPTATVTAVEPAAAPAEPAPNATPERLAITFDVNSSYLPDSLDGRLRTLAQGMEPKRSYAVRLVGAVGGGDVAGKTAEEANRYNRWMAERRVDRVAEYLQRTAKDSELKIERTFAANDPSRQVLVEVTPVVD